MDSQAQGDLAATYAGIFLMLKGNPVQIDKLFGCRCIFPCRLSTSASLSLSFNVCESSADQELTDTLRISKLDDRTYRIFLACDHERREKEMRRNTAEKHSEIGRTIEEIKGSLQYVNELLDHSQQSAAPEPLSFCMNCSEAAVCSRLTCGHMMCGRCMSKSMQEQLGHNMEIFACRCQIKDCFGLLTETQLNQTLRSHSGRPEDFCVKDWSVKSKVPLLGCIVCDHSATEVWNDHSFCKVCHQGCMQLSFRERVAKIFTIIKVAAAAPAREVAALQCCGEGCKNTELGEVAGTGFVLHFCRDHKMDATFRLAKIGTVKTIKW